MSSFVLEAEIRNEKVTPSALRRQKKIPAVFYGKGIENLHFALQLPAFTALYRRAGENNLIDLQVVGGKKFKTLVHAVQYHPVTDEIVHVDLKNIRMDEKLTTRVAVKLTGVAPAVKDFMGIVSLQAPEIEIRCLPGDLIHEILVDISSLKTLRDSIHVSDLVVPKGIEVLLDSQRTIITVLAPKKEEEDAPKAQTAMEADAAAAAAAAAAAPAADKEKKEDKKK
jgi:large subunit ribosomal protein L25